MSINDISTNNGLNSINAGNQPHVYRQLPPTTNNGYNLPPYYHTQHPTPSIPLPSLSHFEGNSKRLRSIEQPESYYNNNSQHSNYNQPKQDHITQTYQHSSLQFRESLNETNSYNSSSLSYNYQPQRQNEIKLNERVNYPNLNHTPTRNESLYAPLTNPPAYSSIRPSYSTTTQLLHHDSINNTSYQPYLPKPTTTYHPTHYDTHVTLPNPNSTIHRPTVHLPHLSPLRINNDSQPYYNPPYPSFLDHNNNTHHHPVNHNGIHLNSPLSTLPTSNSHQIGLKNLELTGPTLPPLDINNPFGIGRATQLTTPKDNFGSKDTTPCDDKDGHLIIVPGQYLSSRYKVIQLLGQGTFGRVAKCWDKISRTYVAIKVIRAIPKYRDAAKIEMRVLATLKSNDPLNLNKCIHLDRDFEYRNHVCMTFDLMGPSLFDFLKSNQFQGFPYPHVQHFARQILTSVAFLHSLGLVHTDLKPENILLMDGDYDDVPNRKLKAQKSSKMLTNTEIRMIDFGSATFENEYHSSVVSTRHYRAPEIILGMGWSYPCDLWSVGCILVELITGDAMFQTHDNLEHLAMMEHSLGPIPKAMVTKANKSGKAHFTSDGVLDYPASDTTKTSRKHVKSVKPIPKLHGRTGTLGNSLTDLLEKLLTYQPDLRVTATEALRHPFFSLNLDMNGRVKAKKSENSP